MTLKLLHKFLFFDLFRKHQYMVYKTKVKQKKLIYKPNVIPSKSENMTFTSRHVQKNSRVCDIKAEMVN